VGGALRIGVVGAGKISAQYSATIARLPELTVTAVADLDPVRAGLLADRHPGARATSPQEMYAADDVDVVLNLTTPAHHAELALAALAAGKHVYGEKPLAATTAGGHAIVEAAAAAGLRAACAPDTVLGTGVQTARAALDAGAIGTAHAATAFMTTPGHERWHPDPEFYYQAGGGPLLDMGPYYLTALVHLLGPVRRVIGMSSRPRDDRTIGDGPRAGTSFPVGIDTHVTGILEHEGGALTTLMMSFDTWATRLPPIEVYGSSGSLAVPDPNYFGGEVRLFTAGSGAWSVLEPAAGYVDAGRGVGLLDLHDALAGGRPHRAAAEVALHVLDVIESIGSSAVTGRATPIGTTCTRPERLTGLITLP
jgi:predicted dehydrogenase